MTCGWHLNPEEINRGYNGDVIFEVFTAVTKKNVVFPEYKYPVRTSQETHYFSATEPSRFMLCKI
jgi:hypothetical protein